MNGKPIFAMAVGGVSLAAVAFATAAFQRSRQDDAGIVIVPATTTVAAAPVPSPDSATQAAVAASLSGAIYVDCSGAAGGNGSSAAPFNSLAGIRTTITAGSTIYLRRGVRCIGQFHAQGSGTASAPIRVMPYGSGTARPIIDGNGIAGDDEAGSALYLLNQEYWRISGVEVTNTASSIAVRNGISVILRDFRNGTGSDGKPQGVGRGIYLDDVYVHDVAGGGGSSPKASNGIQFKVAGTGVANWFDGIQVTNSRIANVGREGLVTNSVQKCRTYMDCSPNPATSAVLNQWRPQRNVLFKSNLIENVGGDGIVIRASTGALVQDNIGRNLATRSWPDAASAGFWAINSDNTEFSFNQVSGTRKTPGNNDGTAFDADYTNNGIIFKQNYTFDNEGGFMLLCGSCGGSRTTGIVIRDNISINDGTVAKRLFYAAGAGYKDGSGNPVAPAEIYANTFYVPSTSAYVIFNATSSTNVINFRNNIVHARGTITPVNGTTTNFLATWAKNIFQGMSASVAPAGSLLVDPKFAGPVSAAGPWPTGYAPTRDYALLNAFRLQSSSPARNAGAQIYAVNVGDFFGGTQRPTKCAPDIGAHQYAAPSTGCR